jgi:methylated-DNA-[protein]-cysteine S-methyltransferase
VEHAIAGKLRPFVFPLVERWVASPVGRLRLVANDRALVGVFFPDHVRPAELIARRGASHDVLESAARELDAYFAGRRRSFSTPLAPRGTQFQRAVWEALLGIPFGETRSYAQLAAELGHPRAVRAVGSANARNPLAIFVPCHRVIGKDGALSGYAGGTATKRWLLDHERGARPIALAGVEAV